MVVDKKLMGIILFIISLTFFYSIPAYFGEFRLFFVFVVIIIIMASIKVSGRR